MKKFILSVWISSTILLLGAQNVAAGSATPLKNCVGGYGIDTAVGCIPFLTSGGDANTTGLAAFFLTWGLGIGGGVALVLMVLAGYMIITSSGDPRRLQSGKELLTTALSGLMLLLFSAYILRIIGFTIFKIPGF